MRVVRIYLWNYFINIQNSFERIQKRFGVMGRVSDVSRNVLLRGHFGWAKGQGPRGFRLVQKGFCVGEGPDSEVRGVSGNARNLVVSCWKPRRTLAFQTDFGEALSTSYDPMAQHINRGAGQAPKIQVLETPLVHLALVLVGPS